MPTSSTDLLEIILRECAASPPAPWYPSAYSQETGVPRGALDGSLDTLRLAGLIRLTDWEQGQGQGYTVTPAGEEVLKNPRLLGRLRNGEVPAARPQTPAATRVDGERPAGWQRAKAVKDALMTPRKPVVTYSLIAANVLVFLGGLFLARQQGEGVAKEFAIASLTEQPNDDPAKLADSTRANLIRLDTGALFLSDVVGEGHWWKLLGCCFVHFGLLHLGMNMFFLFSLGRLVEQMWGGGRFLLLYLISGLASSCASLIFTPGGLYAGASGALCGILLSMGAWVYLNRPYLPVSLASSWMRSVGTNVMLIVFISLMPGISAAGHGGGAVAGLVTSFPLVYSRFGQGTQRWLGWLGTLLVPVVSLALVLTNHRVEVAQARMAYRPVVAQAARAMERTKKELLPIYKAGANGTPITPAAAQKALKEVAVTRKELEEVADALARGRPYLHADVNDAISSSRDYVEACTHYLDHFSGCLDAQGKWACGASDGLAPYRDEVDKAARQVEKSVLVSS